MRRPCGGRGALMEQVIVGADGGGSEGVRLGDNAAFIPLFDPEQQQVHTGGARPAPEPQLLHV